MGPAPSWRALGNPVRVLLDVLLGVLHQDAVAGEGRALHPALDHGRDPLLEDATGFALVGDGDGGPVVADGEVQGGAVLGHRAVVDGALQPESLVAGALGAV